MPAESESIRPAVISDIPALSQLFQEVFREQRDQAVWRWKYFDNPRGYLSVVCEAQGRLVTHAGGVPVEMCDGDRSILGVQLVDFMSSPSYAGGLGGGGVYARTAERFLGAAKQKGVAFVYGFPGERHRIAWKRLIGYSTIEPVGDLTLEPGGSGGKISPLTRDLLGTFLRPPSGLSVRRTHDYLRWRYLGHPTHLYGYVEVRRWLRRKPEVAAIVRETPEIVYLMEIGGSLADSAIAHMTEKLRSLGRPVKFWCSPTHALAGLLERSGFRLSWRDHSIGGAWFRNDVEENSRKSFVDLMPARRDFYYTLGDYDVY